MATGDLVQAFINSANVGVLSGTGVTVGDLISIWGRFFGETAAPTFVDSVGNTWVTGDGFLNGSSWCQEYYCLAATHTSFSMVFTGAGSFPQIVGAQFSSAGATWSAGGSSPQHGTGSQGSGTWTSTALTVAVADLVLGLWENETANGINFSDAGGFTHLGSAAAGNATMSYKVAASVSETPEIGSDTTGSVGWLARSFTPSTAGGPGTRCYSYILD